MNRDLVIYAKEKVFEAHFILLLFSFFSFRNLADIEGDPILEQEVQLLYHAVP